MATNDPPTSDTLLTREDLARRWRCSIPTIKRREKAGVLLPVRLGTRMIRYRMGNIIEAERTSR